eukprot:COSAG01_NODE_55314_length_326_cov_0.660793_1_plen_32_part_10
MLDNVTGAWVATQRWGASSLRQKYGDCAVEVV